MKDNLKLNTVWSVIIIVLLAIGIYYLNNRSVNKEEESIIPKDVEIKGERVDLSKEELPSSFILKATSHNEKVTANTASLDILTYTDNYLTSGEIFYNIKEGDHCPANCNKYDYQCKKECTHIQHCIIDNGNWVEAEKGGKCPFTVFYSMTTEGLKNEIYTQRFMPLNTCTKLPGVTCYEIIKI
jgi:hypothetical protein